MENLQGDPPHDFHGAARRGVSQRRRRIPCCRLCTYRGCLLCTIRFSDKSKTLIFMRFILQHYDTSTYLLRMRQNAILCPLPARHIGVWSYILTLRKQLHTYCFTYCSMYHTYQQRFDDNENPNKCISATSIIDSFCLVKMKVWLMVKSPLVK